jgi:hypothetical protein
MALAKAAELGGAIVYLPRGTYRLLKPLSVPKNVVLSGENRDTTFLNWDDTEAPPPALIQGYSDFTIENLTIVSGRHFHVIQGGFPTGGNQADGENITLGNLRIRAYSFGGHLKPEEEAARQRAALAFARNGVDSIRLAGRNLVVSGCDVWGSGRSLYLLRPRGALITGNTLSNGRQGWYSISGPDGVLFTNNEVVGGDLESTGGGINTMFAGTGVSAHVLMRGNTFKRLYGWDGEAITTDGPGGFFYGRVRATEGHSLTMQDPPTNRTDLTDWRGAGVFVMAGRGRGSWARVVARGGDRVTLDRPLPLDPDDSSVISIAPFLGQLLILDNTIEDAAFGIQIFGTGVETITAGNRLSRTRGILIKALYYQHVQPTWYNQVLNNEILTPSLDGTASIGIWGNTKTTDPGAINLMTIVRGNTLYLGSFIELRGQPPFRELVSDALVEHNTIVGGQRPAAIRGGVIGSVVRANTMRDAGGDGQP